MVSEVQNPRSLIPTQRPGPGGDLGRGGAPRGCPQARAAAVAATRAHHCDGSSDNPAWTDEGTGWTCNIGGIGGDLSAIHDSAGATTYQLANLHGDVVGTTGADGTLTSANGTTDEYGTPRDTATTGQRRYGRLGTSNAPATPPAGSPSWASASTTPPPDVPLRRPGRRRQRQRLRILQRRPRQLP